ncbi:AAA family ATPase [Tepidibacter hydrothermalis]|uniref:Nuclease SbcCD subunit C n=1 Tax=Tepidibacter hydrothermalis TaxID=3036126 RepID=A0ABY8E779_9FIRM|nr:AAA family ATPase [Tepidibacter hydrothermalis]WFD08751.1 AAA family ATPase [Tepidibacter hydrothermalis]
MNKFMLRKINYYGQNYYFESPQFTNGLNLITGDNGSGKSTLSDLIYYSLGGTVKQFNPKESEVHKQIIDDKNNFVECYVDINNVSYKFVRKFNSDESNIIIVENIKTQQSDSYYLNRNSEKFIFSDWLLDKLEIPKLKLYQGSKSFILGFNHLMRLLYHHQLSDSYYIHKQPDGKSNYINDSLDIRKTIFEVLTSNASIEYYDSINKLKVLEYKILSKKNLVDAIITTNREINKEFGKSNSKFVQQELDELTAQKNAYEEMLESYEIRIRKNYDEDIENIKIGILKTQEKINKNQDSLNILTKELDEFYTLHKVQQTEIKNIERIILSSEYLGIFTPDKCPICSKEIDRKIGKCICGTNLDERVYQNFFYTQKDHNNILSTKKVAIRTTEDAIRFNKNEILNIEERLNSLNKIMSIKRKELLKLVSNTPEEQLFSKIRSLNKSILELEKKIESKRVILDMLRKYELEYKALKELEEKYNDLFLSNKTHETKHQAKMQKIIRLFSEVYQSFLINTDKEIINAKIDSDYLPIINEGYYKNTASKVHRRLFYYMSLLKLSISGDIPHPKFMLVDTPQNFGIDAEALKIIFTEIEKFCIEYYKEDFQIILTIKSDFVNHLEDINPIYNIDDKLLIPTNE